MNLTRITTPYITPTISSFAPYTSALSLIIRFTNPSTASALIQALAHAQTYSLRMVFPVASFPNSRSVFTKSKFRPRSVQPLRSRLLPLRAPRRIYLSCAAPNKSPVTSFYHSNFNHPSNAWQLNFLETCVSYRLLGPANIEHFYANITGYAPPTAGKTAPELADKPQAFTSSYTSPARRLKLFKTYIASKLRNSGLQLKSPTEVNFALRTLSQSEPVKTSPYLFLGLRTTPSKISISPITSMWSLLQSIPDSPIGLNTAPRVNQTLKSAQAWRSTFQHLLKIGKLAWSVHTRTIISQLTHTQLPYSLTGEPLRPLAAAHMRVFRGVQTRQLAYPHVLPPQPHPFQKSHPLSTGEAYLDLNPRGTSLKASTLTKKSRSKKALRAFRRRTRSIRYLFKYSHRYTLFCNYYRSNGARLPLLHLRSLAFLKYVWFRFTSRTSSISPLRAPLCEGTKLGSAISTRATIQFSKAIVSSSRSSVKAPSPAFKLQIGSYNRHHAHALLPPVTVSLDPSGLEVPETPTVRPFEPAAEFASLSASLSSRLFNRVRLLRPKSIRPSDATPLPTRLFYLLSPSTPVLEEPACQYPEIRPNYSWRFLTSPFSFIHYITTASFPSHDVVRMSRSASDLPSYLTFPDTDVVKASVFRRLNQQKLILQSRSTLHNAYAAQQARHPQLPLSFRGSHLATSSFNSSLPYKVVSHLTTLSKNWLHGRSIHLFRREVTNDVTPRIPRIRFKPGYGRIWRAARRSIKEILNLHACYQYRLTPQLQLRYFQARRAPINQLSFTLGFALMTSKFSVDHWTTSTLLNAHNVFLNGSSCSNPETRLFANDFIQLLVNLKFYIALRWLKGWSQLNLNKINKIFYRKIRPGIHRVNKTPKLSRNLPITFFDLQYTYSDIPKYFEVDYFTLSIFVVHNQVDLERSLPTRANLFNPLTLNMYNWKYIT